MLSMYLADYVNITSHQSVSQQISLRVPKEELQACNDGT
jgi:hypothetical protein